MLSLPDNYPCVPPVFEIEANQSGSFDYRDADDLFESLMEESLKRVGGMMVFDLVTFAQEHMPGQFRDEKKKAKETEGKLVKGRYYQNLFLQLGHGHMGYDEALLVEKNHNFSLVYSISSFAACMLR